jgi:erythrin-vacuolar iron transport family protein
MDDAIDFGALSLKDALDLAVQIEDQSRDRYVDLIAHALLHHCDPVALFFDKMAGHERRHRDVLVERRRELFGDQPTDVELGATHDVEGAERDPIESVMTVREALQVALRAERKAYLFFSRALSGLRDPEVIALFTELRAEEVQHQILVLAELEKTPPESILKTGT